MGTRLFSSSRLMFSAVSKTFLGARALARPAARLYSVDATQVKLTFACPHEVINDETEVDWVAVPGKDGVFGVYPNHVPTISELNPGVVTVSAKGEETKYFVSGGFVEVNRDSACNIACIEAVPVSAIDAKLARQGLERSQNALSNASSDNAKATAEIGVQVHSAMVAAVESS